MKIKYKNQKNGIEFLLKTNKSSVLREILMFVGILACCSLPLENASYICRIHEACSTEPSCYRYKQAEVYGQPTEILPSESLRTPEYLWTPESMWT